MPGEIDETRFNIHFDYRFDSMGILDDPARRALLEYAALAWSSQTADEFDTIPAGTEILVRNPEDHQTAGTVFPIEYAIDDLVVFVGFNIHDGPGGTLAGARASAAIGSVSDPTLSALLATRFNEADFQPWTGWMSFDLEEPYFYDPTPETADDIPMDQIDFLTVAMHELGHVLGIGASDAYDALVMGTTFIGTQSVATYGAPVPLSPDGFHIDIAVMSDGRRLTMDPSDPPGQRFPPTPLDLALLQDLGYSPL
jgi:hypothetical protein